MKLKTYIQNSLLAFCVLLFAIPSGVSAATVFLESSRDTVSVGDTFVLTVKINSDGEVINTVDGNIRLSIPNDAVSIQEFSLANSSFGVWPRTPSLSLDSRTVSFVGGVPGGFSIEGATVFSMIVRAEKSGEVEFTPQDVSVFLNDGAGSKSQVSTRSTAVSVVERGDNSSTRDDWTAVVSEDTIPPEDFIIVLGQDESLFDGKKFAFFSAVDNQSGIDHYEVIENGKSPVRSGSTYVLQDQSDNVTLRVIAIDKAGNTKTASYPVTAEDRPISWISIITVLVLVLGIRFMFRKWKQKTNIVSNA